MPIRLLDKEVIAQIAAGEVVERPASVVKELVENALDAGATQVTVETRGGGVGLIRVSDDGGGIPAAEVGVTFQRHATSKIATIDDLQSITTLGFRGEALASIAAAADVELLTRAEAEPAATSLRLENGGNVRSEAGRSRGTTITVRNLFRSVPARLKFLKSAATEGSHIAAVVSQYALAYPEVKFSLVNEGKASLQTPGRGQLIDSVIEVYGAELARDTLEVKAPEGEWHGGGIKVTGLVGAPSVSRSSRNYLSFFVNRRWVNSRLLGWAVEEAYYGLLMTGKHPVAVINIALPPWEVDVNIHPAKSEVRFRDEHAVFAAVQRAVRRSLIDQAPVPRIEEVATAYRSPPGIQTRFAPPARAVSPPLPEVKQPPLAMGLPVLRVLGQVFRRYIVAEGPDGLYLIDQHAAHERILFDKLNEQKVGRGIEVQSLMEPATFEVSPEQAVTLRLRTEELAGLGFILEPFGERAYLVRGIPGLLNGKDWAGALRELLDSVKGDWREAGLATIACHSAVRSGQVLGEEEMREMVRRLEQAANPHTCPHGRPTIVHLSSRQLEREFGRT